jgi:hypothetical protein
VKKKNVVSISLLIVIFVAATIELQGMAVKAIDETTSQVSGFLPYYVGSDNNIHALVGEYTDAAGNKLVSAPVEISGYANEKGNANLIIKQYFSNPLNIINTRLNIEYQIDEKNKSYDIWTVEVAQSDVADLMQSLKKVNGPADIKDINVNQYVPGNLFGAKIKPGKVEPLFVDFMKKSMFGLSSALEMKMARGFADLFIEMTKNTKNFQMYFVTAIPVDMKKQLKAFASALNKLTSALSNQPEETSVSESSSSQETPVITSENVGLMPEETQVVEQELKTTELEELQPVESEVTEEIPDAPGNPFGGA